MLSKALVSQGPFSRLLVLACCLMPLLLLSGCASAGMPAAAEPVLRATPIANKQAMSQLIVKFKDPTLDPARPGYLKELARALGATLVYVRPMSGDAHVLRVDDAVDASRLQRIVEGLAKRPEVEYAEPDQLMHTMPRP